MIGMKHDFPHLSFSLLYLNIYYNVATNDIALGKMCVLMQKFVILIWVIASRTCSNLNTVTTFLKLTNRNVFVLQEKQNWSNACSNISMFVNLSWVLADYSICSDIPDMFRNNVTAFFVRPNENMHDSTLTNENEFVLQKNWNWSVCQNRFAHWNVCMPNDVRTRTILYALDASIC